MIFSFPDRQPAKSTGVRLWLIGIRPRTLTIALSPVIAGTGLAYHDNGTIDWLVFGISLFCALAIQAGTNLYNDAADGLRGGDTRLRAGPPRLTALGQADSGSVKRAAMISFMLAALGGTFLVFIGGWPILIVGLVSILCGYGYSSGPIPISHTPLGEIFVVTFFGVVAVSGTHYLQTGLIGTGAILTGVTIGLFAAAVLMVNNCRDIREDYNAGRKTLAIIAGKRLSVLVYNLLLLLPFVIVLATEMSAAGNGNWLPLLTLPFALFLAWRFGKIQEGPDYNMLLVQTAKLQLAFSMLFALGLVTLTLEQAQ
ncbi:MAG: 1,4-dihydroxy-2-naphthoate octaprenyltransferase [Hyphomicrobiales bacterium]|nr:1,4-dihydroxy-2-naphthoate octaprenyltransferase [Hyphomicrobiales bacterium]